MTTESAEYLKNKRLEKKRALIAMLGGECSKCGYDRCISAFDFHHKDSTTKSFEIANNLTRSLDVLRAEAAKCVLLCANCHREEHHANSIGGRPRNKAIVELIITRKRDGLTNQQIADELGITRMSVGRRLRAYMDPDEYKKCKRR